MWMCISRRRLVSKIFAWNGLFNHPATTEIYTYWHTLSPTRRSSDLRIDRADDVAVTRVAQRDRRAVRLGGLDHRQCPAVGRHREIAILVRGGKRRAGDRHEKQSERSEEHTSELQSLMRISYAVFCLKKKKKKST